MVRSRCVGFTFPGVKVWRRTYAVRGCVRLAQLPLPAFNARFRACTARGTAGAQFVSLKKKEGGTEVSRRERRSGLLYLRPRNKRGGVDCQIKGIGADRRPDRDGLRGEQDGSANDDVISIHVNFCSKRFPWDGRRSRALPTCPLPAFSIFLPSF